MILLSVLVWCAAGCQPLGFAGEDEAAARVDSLMVMPHRSLYAVNDVLSRQNDVSVFAYYPNGIMVRIPPEEVEIGIIETLDPSVRPVPPGDNYCFMTSGVKGVVVTYQNAANTVSAQYTVQVIDPHGVGGGVSGGGNGPGITIIW